MFLLLLHIFSNWWHCLLMDESALMYMLFLCCKQDFPCRTMKTERDSMGNYFHSVYMLKNCMTLAKVQKNDIKYRKPDHSNSSPENRLFNT